MAHAVGACVHCGFCLPACPTYSVLGEEMDSPRADRVDEIRSRRRCRAGGRPADIDRCLGCLGCVTACPSGVSYGELIMPFRVYAQERRQRSLSARISPPPGAETLPIVAGSVSQPSPETWSGRFRACCRLSCGL